MPLEVVSHTRFEYDFIRDQPSPSRQLFASVLGPRNPNVQNDTSGDVALALSAIALANFHARHYDLRASHLSLIKYGKALCKLNSRLSQTGESVPEDLVLMAVILGIYQNIVRMPVSKPQLLGSWIHHFRGSVNMLAASGTKAACCTSLALFLSKQALMSRLRIGVLISLPTVIRQSFEQATDLQSRATQLGFRVVTLHTVFRDAYSPPHNCMPRHALAEQVVALEQDFRDLLADMKSTIPSDIKTISGRDHPRWYWPISMHSGAPIFNYYFQSQQAASIWLIYYTARLQLYVLRMKLHAAPGILSAQVNSTHDLSSCDLPDAASGLTKTFDDIAAIVFPILTETWNGNTLPTSFDSIRSITTYTIMMPLQIARNTLSFSPGLATVLAPAKLAWIINVLCVLEEKAGVNEAWCWRDEDEDVATAAIQRELVRTE